MERLLTIDTDYGEVDVKVTYVDEWGVDYNNESVLSPEIISIEPYFCANDTPKTEKAIRDWLKRNEHLIYELL